MENSYKTHKLSHFTFRSRNMTRKLLSIQHLNRRLIHLRFGGDVDWNVSSNCCFSNRWKIHLRFGGDVDWNAILRCTDFCGCRFISASAEMWIETVFYYYLYYENSIHLRFGGDVDWNLTERPVIQSYHRDSSPLRRRCGLKRLIFIKSPIMKFRFISASAEMWIETHIFTSPRFNSMRFISASAEMWIETGKSEY